VRADTASATSCVSKAFTQPLAELWIELQPLANTPALPLTLPLVLLEPPSLPLLLPSVLSACFVIHTAQAFSVTSARSTPREPEYRHACSTGKRPYFWCVSFVVTAVKAA
jgi:hypothetical protein